MSNYPNVKANLIETDSGYLWRIKCPHCGGYHLHGGGSLNKDPKDFLGHRVSHCSARLGEDRSYVLTDGSKEAQA